MLPPVRGRPLGAPTVLPVCPTTLMELHYPGTLPNGWGGLPFSSSHQATPHVQVRDLVVTLDAGPHTFPHWQG